MGFKTTFSNTKGVFTESVDGDSVVVFDSVKQTAPMVMSVTVVDVDGNATVSAPYTLFRPSTAAGVTASLPAISTANIGTMYAILKNAGTNPVLVSGTNNVTDGGDWDVVISTAGQTYKVLATSGSNGFYWHVV
jgi:hypothetical protein